MLQLPRLGHMLPRLLALLSLQRNADKLVMRSGTPRKSSKGSTEMVRGNGTGRELDSKLLHLRHLLLSPLLHLPQFLVTPHFHPQHQVRQGAQQQMPQGQQFAVQLSPSAISTNHFRRNF